MKRDRAICHVLAAYALGAIIGCLIVGVWSLLT